MTEERLNEPNKAVAIPAEMTVAEAARFAGCSQVNVIISIKKGMLRANRWRGTKMWSITRDAFLLWRSRVRYGHPPKAKTG